MTVNGRPVIAAVPAETTLLRFLRDHLGLTGAKCGCGVGELRRVHGDSRTARRKSHASLRMGRLEGASGSDYRGPFGRWRASSPESVHRQGRDSMRFLHAGHDYGRQSASGSKPRHRPETTYIGLSRLTTAAAPVTLPLSRPSRRRRGSSRVKAPSCPSADGCRPGHNRRIGTGQLGRARRPRAGFVFSDDLYFDGMCYGALLLSGVPTPSSDKGGYEPGRGHARGYPGVDGQGHPRNKQVRHYPCRSAGPSLKTRSVLSAIPLPL